MTRRIYLSGFTYLATSAAVYRACDRCDGTGEYSYNPLDGTKCFKCAGHCRGKLIGTEADAAKDAKTRRAAKVRRDAKRAAEQAAAWEAGRAEREAAAAAEAAELAAIAAERASWQYLAAEIGAKVTVTGVIAYAKLVDTMYGSTMLYVLKLDGEPVEVKMFTSAAWAWAEGTERGERFTITGTVKAHEEYEGKRGTLLARVKGTPAA